MTRILNQVATENQFKVLNSDSELTNLRWFLNAFVILEARAQKSGSRVKWLEDAT